MINKDKYGVINEANKIVKEYTNSNYIIEIFIAKNYIKQ